MCSLSCSENLKGGLEGSWAGMRFRLPEVWVRELEVENWTDVHVDGRA